MILGFTLFVLVGTFAAAQGMNTYTVYIPKLIRPGFDVSITASILSAPNTVVVTARLLSTDNATALQASSTINPETSGTLVLGQIPRGYKGSHSFTMTVSGVDSVTNDRLFTNSTSDFTFASKSLSILIQTDKAIYQPGQTIKFRAVCLKPDLRPLTGVVEYSVMDPNGNTVLLNGNVSLSHGVAGGELSLHKDAVAGMWKITFTASGYEKGLEVEVKFYKLPKFKVEIDVPSFIHADSPGLVITVKGTYTYGKPVKGKATVSMSLGFAWIQPVYYSNRGFGLNSDQWGIEHSFENFDGDVSIFVPLDDVKKLLGWDGGSDRKITVRGSVTEEVTGVTFNETVSVDVKESKIKVEALYKPNTIKPGLSYTAYLKVTEQDGKLLTESDRNNEYLNVDIFYYYPYAHRFPDDVTTPSPWVEPMKSETKMFGMNPDGSVAVTIEAKNDEFRRVSFRVCPSVCNPMEAVNWDVKRAESPSNSYLQVTTRQYNVRPDHNASISIRSTEDVPKFRIMLLSRGGIVSDFSFPPPQPSSRSHTCQFSVTHNMMPGVQVLVSYVRPDGEIVADYLKLTVSTELEHQISVQSSETVVDAGTDVSIRVQTSSAGAYVGVRAIDQSVLLLKSGSDITKQRVINDINGYSNADNFYSDDIYWSWWYPVPSGARDASEVFSNAGMIVLTDALLYKVKEEHYSDCGMCDIDESVGAMYMPAAMDLSIASSLVERPKTKTIVRSHFPESWLWDGKVAGPDGSATFATTAPDTITSWVWSVFSVSDQYGLGLTDTFKITVFRQFFVTLNLPLKVTRGEIIVVQAVVFNYLESSVTANFHLGSSNKFELIIPGNDSVAAGPRRKITVPSNGAISVKFPIRVNTLGEVPITVSATSELASDALTRVVYVRPEGIQQCYSTSILVSRESISDQVTRHNLRVNVPAGIVPDSAKVKLSIYGDILGNTLNNLGRLLKAPYGCGEQNMVNFAPDVFVTLYLHKANRLEAATRKKAFEHFYNGYMKELQYKHNDGSYSVFGQRDKSGSTWLTTFVAKCFIFAREIRPELVEERIIDQALDFLVKQQNRDGSFIEPGKVSSKVLQGGVNSVVTMTAYVLVTLRETNYAFKNRNIQAASNKARQYLENNLHTVINDKYDLSIVTYALHVSESSRASEALTALNRLVTTEGGMRYWTEGSGDESTLKSTWRRPYYGPRSNDIEMTSYALLTYVRRNESAMAAPIMKWIASKQNELGGYSSTQDTVIATQAMSSAAGLLVDRTQDLTITATHWADKKFSRSIHITSINLMIFNQIDDFPPSNGDVVIAASGVGVGVAQLSVCYNTPTDTFETEPFQCTTNIKESNQKSARLDFCCNLKPGDNATGMFTFTVDMPNGFTVNLDEEKQRNSGAQLVEMDQDKVNVYYDNLEPNNERCAKLKMVRYAEVGDSKPQPVSAFDYYNPGRKVERLIDVTSFHTSVCEVCGWECVGCPGPQLSEWSSWTPCVRFCESEISSRSKQCIDPNTNTVLQSSHCGLTDLPTEFGVCVKEGFPCPVFNHGLWLSLPHHYQRAIAYQMYNQDCSIRGRSRMQSSQDLPGVSINFRPLMQYIYCKPSPQLSGMLNTEQGFTISFLIRRSGDLLKPQVYLAFGGKNQPPVCKFEKLWWQTEFKFSLNFNGVLYRVQRITNEHFPAGIWNHLVITWNVADGAKVYINGMSAGISSQHRVQHVFSKPQRPVLTLGGSAYGSSWQRGYARASFSSLDIWMNSFTQAEVASLYSFYQSIVGANNANPVISVRQLKHFSPPELRQCFTRPSTLAEIYQQPGPASQLLC